MDRHAKDCDDLCPLDFAKTNPQKCGCSVLDSDVDADGTPDCNDVCPGVPDVHNGIAGCIASALDRDGDGTIDALDQCPLDATKTAPGLCGC